MNIKIISTLFIFMPFSATGQGAGYDFTVGAHYISAIDYSIQKTNTGTAGKSNVRGYPSFEIFGSIHVKNNFTIETGYRLKQHDISYGNLFGKSSQWIETTHSVPLRIGWNKMLTHTRWLRKFTCSISGGPVLDIMQRSDGLPLITSTSFIVKGPSGTYTFSADYLPNEVNQVKHAVSLDVKGYLGHRIFKNVEVFLGYGFTQGFKSIAKGHYTIITTDSTGQSGIVINKGTYVYSTAGVNFLLK